MRFRAVRISLALKVLFLFFGTFLHELAHFVAALIFGKPVGFSIIPRISGESLVFGSVKAQTKYRVLSSFIAIAPLLWWFLLFFLLSHFHVLRPGTDFISSFLGTLKSLTLTDVIVIWLLLQLLWAGRLSGQDIRTFLSGVFSPSGMLLGAMAAVLIFVFEHMRPDILRLR